MVDDLTAVSDVAAVSFQDASMASLLLEADEAPAQLQPGTSTADIFCSTTSSLLIVQTADSGVENSLRSDLEDISGGV